MVLSGLHVAAGAAVWALGLHENLYPWMLRDAVPAAADASGLGWFLITALPLLAFGWLLRWAVAVTGRLPPRELFVAAAVTCVGLGALFPISGFWICAGLCGWIALSAGSRRG